MRLHDLKMPDKSHDDRGKALQFLKENHTMVIATTTPECIPHAATVFYTVDEYFNLYFCAGEETEKFLNIQDNSRTG